jgi:hypothetical protein
MNKQFEGIAILTVRQKLSPAFEGDPIKPPTFAGKDNEPTYVIYDVKGRRDCIIDTQCRCSKIMSPLNCNQTLSPYQDGDDESERVPTGESN